MAKLKSGWERLGKSNGDTIPNLSFSILDIVKNIDMTKATDIVIDAYHSQGYSGGDFENSHFELDESSSSNPAAILYWPTYTKFMLYGRRPGKMPPVAPIESWCKKYGISASPWAVAVNIGKHGTKGNDFITPVLPKISDEFSRQMQQLIEAEMKKLKN